MRKYVAGFVAGVLLTFSFTAYGAEIKSLIGKTIQSESPVLVNGEKLDTAIVVDGKSYAPIRSIGEAVGFEVKYENKQVLLTNTEVTPVPETTPSPTPSQKVEYDENGQRIIETMSLQLIESELKESAATEWGLRVHIEHSSDPKIIEEATAKLEKHLARVVELEKRKAELESAK